MKKRQFLHTLSSILSSPVPVTFRPGDPSCCYNFCCHLQEDDLSVTCFELSLQFCLPSMSLAHGLSGNSIQRPLKAGSCFPALPPFFSPPSVQSVSSVSRQMLSLPLSSSFFSVQSKRKQHHKAQAQPLLQQHSETPQFWIPCHFLSVLWVWKESNLAVSGIQSHSPLI